MQALRLLLCTLLGVGLLMQFSAYAAAFPASSVSMDQHCKEIQAEGGNSAAHDTAMRDCKDMAQDCLSGANCSPPVLLPDAVPLDLSSASVRRPFGLPALYDGLASPQGPEPPPPEMSARA